MKIKPPLPLYDGKFFIDNSFFTNLQRCRRQAVYENIHRLVPDTKRTALEYGTCIHKVLEARYKLFHIPTSEFLANHFEEAFQKAFADYVIDFDEWRNVDYAQAQLLAYFKLYANEDFKIIGEGCELPFTIHLFDHVNPQELKAFDNVTNQELTIPAGATLPVHFWGRIDLVIRRDFEILVMDHKTSSQGGSTIFDEYYTGAQFKGYAWALTQILQQPVKGVLLNILVGRRPTKTGKAFEFLRQPVLYSDYQIAEWKENITKHIQNFLSTYALQTAEDVDLLHNPQSCIHKYGRCNFYDVCRLQQPDLRDLHLSSTLYKHNTWTPISTDK